MNRRRASAEGRTAAGPAHSPCTARAARSPAGPASLLRSSYGKKNSIEQSGAGPQACAQQRNDARTCALLVAAKAAARRMPRPIVT
jgi:hypothetical protein